MCNLFWSVNFYFILKNKWLRKKLADPGSGLREALDSTERNRSGILLVKLGETSYLGRCKVEAKIAKNDVSI